MNSESDKEACSHVFERIEEPVTANNPKYDYSLPSQYLIKNKCKLCGEIRIIGLERRFIKIGENYENEL